jgi:hypothetical protein
MTDWEKTVNDASPDLSGIKVATAKLGKPLYGKYFFCVRIVRADWNSFSRITRVWRQEWPGMFSGLSAYFEHFDHVVDYLKFVNKHRAPLAPRHWASYDPRFRGDAFPLNSSPLEVTVRGLCSTMYESITSDPFNAAPDLRHELYRKKYRYRIRMVSTRYDISDQEKDAIRRTVGHFLSECEYEATVVRCHGIKAGATFHEKDLQLAKNLFGLAALSAPNFKAQLTRAVLHSEVDND